MGISQLEWARRLRNAGAALGREKLAQRSIAVMAEYAATNPNSYTAAMKAAGQLKAIAAAAKYDSYWTEKVDDGFHHEMELLERQATTLTTDRPTP